MTTWQSSTYSKVCIFFALGLLTTQVACKFKKDSSADLKWDRNNNAAQTSQCADFTAGKFIKDSTEQQFAVNSFLETKLGSSAMTNVKWMTEDLVIKLASLNDSGAESKEALLQKEIKKALGDKYNTSLDKDIVNVSQRFLFSDKDLKQSNGTGAKLLFEVQQIVNDPSKETRPSCEAKKIAVARKTENKCDYLSGAIHLQNLTTAIRNSDACNIGNKDACNELLGKDAQGKIAPKSIENEEVLGTLVSKIFGSCVNGKKASQGSSEFSEIETNCMQSLLTALNENNNWNKCNPSGDTYDQGNEPIAAGEGQPLTPVPKITLISSPSPSTVPTSCTCGWASAVGRTDVFFCAVYKTSNYKQGENRLVAQSTALPASNAKSSCSDLAYPDGGYGFCNEKSSVVKNAKAAGCDVITTVLNQDITPTN